jgi:hypothetical protein
MTMKKLLSTLVAALVAVSFTGVVFAAEPAKKGAGPAPSAPAVGEIKKEETKPARKKSGKVKPVKKRVEEKKESAPSPAEKK